MKKISLINPFMCWQLLASLLLLVLGCRNTEVEQNPAQRITIEVSLDKNWMNQPIAFADLKDKLEMKYTPVNAVAFKPLWNSINGKISGGKCTWIIYSSEPVMAYFGPSILKIVSPGDSIHVSYLAGHAAFSGRGEEKLKLWGHLKEIEEKLIRPTKASFKISALTDYQRWDKYAVDMLAIQLPIIDSTVSNISRFEYDYLKTETISLTEGNRVDAFTYLLNEFRKQKLTGISVKDLCNLWDSTQYRDQSSWLRSQADFTGSIYVISLFNELEVARKFGFDFQRDSLSSKDKRNYLYYTAAKQNFKGLLRERLMAYILVQDVIPKMDTGNPTREWIIRDYYNQPGFPEYKQIVKDLQERKDN